MKKHCLLHGRTTIGERGQIVIPMNIRTALKLKPGDEMVVMSRCEKIVVFPAKQLESWYESVSEHIAAMRKKSKR